MAGAATRFGGPQRPKTLHDTTIALAVTAFSASAWRFVVLAELGCAEFAAGVLAATAFADRLLFGSDCPHAEGLADPASYVNDIAGFSDEEVRKVMRDNACELLSMSAR